MKMNQITFGNPEAIYLLIPLLFLAVIFVLAFKKRDRLLKTFLHTETFSQSLQMRQRGVIISILLLIGFISLLIAIMRPQYGFDVQEVTTRGSDIFILVDVSQSMQAQDVKPSRILRAKRELLDFLKYLSGDRVGLIAFSGKSYVLCPLTNDYDTLALFINDLDTQIVSQQGTDIKGALLTALSNFDQNTKTDSRAIMLLTDGEVTSGDAKDVINQSNDSAASFFIMGLGTTEGAPIPKSSEGGFIADESGNLVISKLNESSLKELATKTNGIYVRSVFSDDDIKTLYYNGVKQKTIATTQKSGMQRVPVEKYYWPLAVAILLLLVDGMYK